MPIKYKIDILEALKEKGFTSYRIRKEKIFGCDLYQIYTDFCEENLLTTLKKNSFVSALKQKGKKKGIIHSTHILIDNTRARGFEGIGKSPKADNYISARF